MLYNADFLHDLRLRPVREASVGWKPRAAEERSRQRAQTPARRHVVPEAFLCQRFQKQQQGQLLNVDPLGHLSIGVERNRKQRNPVNSITSWIVSGTHLCIRFNWSFHCDQLFEWIFFFLSGRKISLSEYPVLPEICVQRWRKKYRCDQNFPSACYNWKQESEINKQYIACQF